MESDPADTPIVCPDCSRRVSFRDDYPRGLACDELRIELARRIFLYAVKLRACKERTNGLGR